MDEKQTTIQIDGWGIVRFPTRWLDLNAMQWDLHALDADHVLAPGCVDLSCLDSIHALANLIFDLREEGYLNRQAAEAFNPALAPKGGERWTGTRTSDGRWSPGFRRQPTRSAG